MNRTFRAVARRWKSLGWDLSTVFSFDSGVDQMQVNIKLLPGKQGAEIPEPSIINGKAPGISSQFPAQMWSQRKKAKKEHLCD